MIFLSGTFSCLKTSLAIEMADKLNIANMISTELIKTVMESLRPEIRLPNSLDLLLNGFTQEQYLELNKNYWKGAVMDITKVFKEGKPLLFEGVLSFKDIIASPNQPSEARWQLAKRYIEQDPTLDLSTLFNKLNPDCSGNTAATFGGLDWLQKISKGVELGPVKEMEKARESPAVIICLILIIPKKDHLNIIRERLLKESCWHGSRLKSVTSLRQVEQRILGVFQALQEQLIKESPGILVPVSISDYDKNCEVIQTLCLEQIGNQFHKIYKK